MAKALAVIYGLPYLQAAAGPGLISVNYAVTVDDGVTNYQDGFTINFPQSAALNGVAFGSAVVAGVSSRGGPSLALTDIIIWGGLLTP